MNEAIFYEYFKKTVSQRGFQQLLQEQDSLSILFSTRTDWMVSLAVALRRDGDQQKDSPPNHEQRPALFLRKFPSGDRPRGISVTIRLSDEKPIRLLAALAQAVSILADPCAGIDAAYQVAREHGLLIFDGHGIPGSTRSYHVIASAAPPTALLCSLLQR